MNKPPYKIRKASDGAWYLFEDEVPLGRCGELDLQTFEWLAKSFPKERELFVDIDMLEDGYAIRITGS